jgi:hypothetical protein
MHLYVTCLQCGVSFTAKPAKVHAGLARYCSVACRGLAMRRRIKHTCEQCGQSFDAIACYAKRGQYRYCGRACYEAARMPAPKPPPLTRDEVFDGQVARSEGCWAWTGTRYPNGYGSCASGRRGESDYAHRRAWERASGHPIPEGLGVFHICDNPPCVRNDDAGTYIVDGRVLPRFGHLFLGTDADNVADKVAKGRQWKGEQMPTARLTDAQVIEMRRRYAEQGVTMTALGREFGVHRVTVHDVVLGVTWRHLLT